MRTPHYPNLILDRRLNFPLRLNNIIMYYYIILLFKIPTSMQNEMLKTLKFRFSFKLFISQIYLHRYIIPILLYIGVDL